MTVAHKPKASAGSVQIKNSNGRLQLVFTFQSKRRYLSLGLTDTPTNRRAAQARAKLLESDIFYDRVDETFETYKPRSKQRIPAIIPTPAKTALADLWEQYKSYKSMNASPKTIDSTYNPVSAHLGKCSSDGLLIPIEFRQELLRVTTESQARRTLMQLSACCNWAIKQQLITENPFEGMYKELKATIPPPPKAFTPNQIDQIIETFEQSKDHSLFTPLVKFLFWTGYRPCEAIGLRWGSVTQNCERIHFHESIVESNGHLYRRDETKTGVVRWFTCTPKLKAMLQAYKLKENQNDDLVFTATNGGAIWLSHFDTDHWSVVLTALNLSYLDNIKMTPYSTRDTFITLQALAGHSSTQIARWVGNSATTNEPSPPQADGVSVSKNTELLISV